MNKPAKVAFLGCGGILALLGVVIIALPLFSGPGTAPPHKFDWFRLEPDACINAFDGRGGSDFSHIWILRSPDLEAWWDPNGLRAEADLILDSADRKVIKELLACTSVDSQLHNSVRTLREGRIYHVLLFNEDREIYAHLKFEYRSEQRDGTTAFSVRTDFDGGGGLTKDCPGFLEFEKRILAAGKID